MNKRFLMILAFLFMLVALGMPARADASGDGTGSSADNRYVVDNYDHGWKKTDLVSKTFDNETHCSWTEHYEWDIDGVFYELDAWENLPCWYGQVKIIPRDPPTMNNRPFIKKCDHKHHSKKFARNHKAHMRRCH